MDSQERVERINRLLDQFGRSVADGLATRWKTEYPQSMEYYRDNVGGWVQYIVKDVVKFDSRFIGVNL
jgi:hypothetical protein